MGKERDAMLYVMRFVGCKVWSGVRLQCVSRMWLGHDVSMGAIGSKAVGVEIV